MFIFRNDKCNCDDYVHLELTREQISKRIKEHKKILKNLKKIAISREMNLLYQCSFCGQYWQESSAWNWGGKTYLFKVPKVDISDWLNEQFASPADILIYSARMNEYFTKNNIKETNKKCKIIECLDNSIEGGVLCKKHFVENLQKVNLLPKPPSGRIFGPYS